MTMARPEGAAPSCGAVGRVLRLAEDPVEIGAALGAHGLRHAGALVVHLDLTRGLALGLALHPVELAAPGLRPDGLLAYVHSDRGRVGKRCVRTCSSRGLPD